MDTKVPFDRKKRRTSAAVPLALLFLFMGCFFPKDFQSGYSLEEVQKVLSVIEDMIEAQNRETGGQMEAAEVTESEFNAYMAYLIDVGNEEVLREVYVNFFQNNRIEGKIRIDLPEERIPRFLKPELNFYLSGRVDVDSGRVRLVVRELFLEKEPVQPALLDLAILLAYRIQNLEPVSLYDWYDLPYGIQDIKTEKGIAFFYY